MMADKDQRIGDLRARVQRLRKADEQRQRQIEDQQREIQRLSGALADQEDQANHVSIDEVAKLERQVFDLQSQLTHSHSSRQLEAKCDRLTSMLEKSQRFYAELAEQHRALSTQTARKRPPLKFNISRVFECFTEDSLEERATGPAAREAVKLASLRKTVLQYFLTDPGNQEPLVPVILELVGCTPNQVQAAVRNVRSNQQLVSRVGSVLAWFG
jgi:small-conductance mechanosensitive channel